ncbi:hypothetical protein OTB20_25200 [Streptomyces sp. H27-H1]|uniref:hypothetical protein n=1 Tax=unclassified Streptomyces TaxID=2593676 RepID=UPI002271C51A|nr:MULTISPECIES: hypothetical protein [unclassified Streptomyces]MCY0929436.1 hypothetical protein [Streptomyces sp. H27-H1]MCY0938348.1 hypothetical protein [Streptomyces sp. H34-S4]
MNLGDALTHEALTTGSGFAVSATATGGRRLAITLDGGGVQHFERPATGGPGDWIATDLEGQASGCAFNEPVTPEWGRGLELIATTRTQKG